LSIFKQLPVTESKRFEFRVEMFNATNTPVWSVPITNLDSPNVGQITSTANRARQIQFGLKFYF